MFLPLGAKTAWMPQGAEHRKCSDDAVEGIAASVFEQPCPNLPVREVSNSHVLQALQDVRPRIQVISRFALIRLGHKGSWPSKLKQDIFPGARVCPLRAAA